MYIEYLSFFNLLIILVKNYQKEISLKNKKIYYFDNSYTSKLIIFLLNLFFNYKFEKIKFKLIEIKDEKNELIRLRIFRKDLIQLQNDIINNNIIFKKIKSDKKLYIYYDYLIKALVDGHLVMDPNFNEFNIFTLFPVICAFLYAFTMVIQKKYSLDKPRLCVYRSNQNLYAQVIDDKTGKTLFSVSTLDKQFKKEKVFGGNKKAAKTIGELLAVKAKDLGVKEVVFDRGGYLYHGRIKALAESARASGLNF